MFAIGVVLHEFVMWSEYEEYVIMMYFTKFFETHKRYIVHDNDLKSGIRFIAHR